MPRDEKIKGSYFHDKILSLIDYRGDIAKKAQIGAEFTVYSQDFSPNNIRRFVISPDGALVQLHIPVQGIPTIKSLRLPTKFYNEISCLDDYIPMLNCLSEDRICASIEEVVIVPNSNDGSVQLNYVEQNVSGLVKGYKGNDESKDVVGDIAKRYKRLRDFCLVTDLSFADVEKYIRSNPNSFVADSEDFETDITYIHENDWFEGYGSSAKFYLLDAKDGRLNLHFQKVRSHYEEQEKQDKLESFKKEQLKGIDGKHEKALNTFKYMYEAKKMLHYFFTKTPSNIVDKSLFASYMPEPVVLNGVGKLKETKSIKLKQGNSSSSSEKSKYNENIKLLNESSSRIYSETVTLLLTCISSLPEPVQCVVMHDCEKSIRIPKNAEPLNQKISQVTGKKFEGENIKNSMLNACTLLTRVFVSDAIDNLKLSQYRFRDSWEQHLKKFR